MASHFKQPDEKPRRTAESGGAPGSTSPRMGGNPRAHLHTRRGGDESYHAPQGNPHAAGTPRSSAGFVPVMTEPASGQQGDNRRRYEPHFVDTDPYDLSGRRSKNPKKRAARIISIILFVVGIGLILAAGGMWIYNQWQYSEQDRINEELATYADVSDDGSTPPQVDWEALKAVNPDVVGWVQIPGTTVNYPVYQGETNDSYLRTNAEGSYSIGGQIFLDYENAKPGMVDSQTIIYGHHLRNGTMFKPVSDMENQEMFDGVSTVWYVTETGTYELQPLLLYHTEATDTNVRKFNFDSVDDFHSYLNDLLSKSVTKRSDASELISSSSKALTLVTCFYDDYEKGRVILVCVPKEPEAVDAAAGADGAADAAAGDAAGGAADGAADAPAA